MSKYKSKSVLKSFKHAGRGVSISVKSEKNIQIHIIAAFVVILCAIILKMSITKICILLIAISNVMVAEFINTSLEFGLDAVFKNKYSKLVGMAKDISAGAVVVATGFSIVIGLLLFGNEVIKLIPPV